MAKHTGTVRWFSNRKGYGFIAATLTEGGDEEEIFVHHSNISAPEGSYRTVSRSSSSPRLLLYMLYEMLRSKSIISKDTFHLQGQDKQG